VSIPSSTAKNALQTLRKAVVDNWEEVSQIDASIGSLEDDRYSIRKTIRYLEDAVKCADDYQLVFAGLIHADLRNRTEKQQSMQKLHGGDGIAAGTILSHPNPARPRSVQIDHWFIGAAATCLDQYRTGTGKKIAGYDHIISALFRVAFGNSKRSEQSIRGRAATTEKRRKASIFFRCPSSVRRMSTAIGTKFDTKSLRTTRNVRTKAVEVVGLPPTNCPPNNH
jgi:hypothetical protein